MSKKKNKKLKYAPKTNNTKTRIREEDWEREDRRQKAINDGEPAQYEYD